MNERDRVLQVMQSEGLNAKQFCQEVGISPGTLSNITNGRNKPSLDVMQAILRRFRTISCDWLIMGVGTMSVSGTHEGSMHSLFEKDIEPHELSNQMPESVSNPPIINNQCSNAYLSHSNSKCNITNSTVSILPRNVDKILIFYSDGTFEER